jgi:tetratricopeptide (TPR) repeat protein
MRRSPAHPLPPSLTRRGRRVGLLGVLLWVSLSAIPRAQTREIEPDQALSDLQQYHGLIDDYRRGNTDGLGQLLRWDRKRILRVLASVDTPKDQMRPWGPGRFKTAVMIHTEVSLDLLERSETENALLHLDVASQLLKKAGQDLRGHVGRWYQAVVGYMRSWNWLPAAEQFLASGRERWERDPIVLYESGTLQELLAGDTSVPTVTNVSDLRSMGPTVRMASAPATAPLTAAMLDDIKRQRLSRLERAARWLEEALKGDPSNVQADLHLGRVQTLRNRHANALELLTKSSRSSDPAVAYLGLLFTAALHERQGRVDDALQAYGGAIARYPLNQAAHIGMSALLQRTGRGDQSRALLRLVVDAAPSSRRDPWWSYFQEPSEVALVRLDVLRREARQ